MNSTFRNDVGTFEITHHARVRARQRGISEETVELILTYADRHVRVGSGCHSLFVSPEQLDHLSSEILMPAECERMAGVVLVVDPQSLTVITALKPSGRQCRRYFRETKTWKTPAFRKVQRMSLLENNHAQ